MTHTRMADVGERKRVRRKDFERTEIFSLNFLLWIQDLSWFTPFLEGFGQKKCCSGQKLNKSIVFGKKCTSKWYILHITQNIIFELHLQVYDKTTVLSRICKYTHDKHFCAYRKAATLNNTNIFLFNDNVFWGPWKLAILHGKTDFAAILNDPLSPFFPIMKNF